MRKAKLSPDQARQILGADSFFHYCTDTKLSVTQGLMLALIDASRPPIRPFQLAVSFAVSRTAVQYALDDLDARSLITREKLGKDGRGVSLRITEEGAKWLEAIPDRA